MKQFKMIMILFLVVFNILFLEKTVVNAVSNKLIIDTENLYPDMTEAYKDGYIPSVSGGKANIVLPLILDNSADAITGSVTATVNYGDITDSPFVIGQYSKQVNSETYTQPDGDVTSAYVINFNLDLKNDRVNGTYLINIVVEYKASESVDNPGTLVDYKQVFPTYITITDGTDSAAGLVSTSADAKVMLENYNINPVAIYVGNSINVSANLKNMSQSMSIKNMKINYENSEGVFTPADHSGSLYIDEIPAGQTKNISFQMNTASNVTNYNQKITLNIVYEDAAGKSYSDTENIYITIQPTPESVRGSTSNLFEIETNHTFVGMDSSYNNGYVPTTQNGKVRVIMPLNFKGNSKVYGDEITASIEFVSTDKQPFKIKSYVKKVKLSNCQSKEGDVVSLYLADFSMDLEKDRLNGVYPVNIKIQYELDSVVKVQTFTAYVVVQDGIDSDEKDPTAKIIVTSCTEEPSSCHEGDIVTFKVSLKNTNTTMDVQNIILTYTSDTGDLRPSEDNNSIYIDSIKAGETKDITFKMKIAGEVSTPNQSVSLKIEGEDKTAKAISQVESLYLSVELPFGLKAESPVLAASMKSGSKQTIKFPIMNTGKTKIRNVICELSMEGVISTSTFFLGELDPATSQEVSIDTIIANKTTTDATVPESEKYGYVTGTITVNYEDTEGKTYSEVLDVSTNITPKTETATDDEISSQWWISIIIGLVIIQIIIFIIIFFRKRRSI